MPQGSLARRQFLKMGAGGLVAAGALARATAGRAERASAPAAEVPAPAAEVAARATAGSGRPNIVFIITDQQRWDTIAALGAPWMITPHLDRLVKEGVAFTHAYCQAPSCVASRHALMTGYHAPATGVFSFDQWTGRRDWLRHFREGGYHLASIGKVHYQPRRDEPAWWHHRVIVENKSEGPMPSVRGGARLDDWGAHLAAKGIPKPMRRDLTRADFEERLGAFPWEFDEADQSDMWTGDRAVEWIREAAGKRPFFLWVGFPGPHEPYDPPPRFVEMYRGREMPPPSGSYAEMADPANRKAWESKAYADFIEKGEGDHRIALSKADLARIAETRRHYFANVTAIDEKVGEILGALEERGILDETVVVFTSDHGDALFDHGLVYKWNPYQGSVRVPLIVRYPKAFATGATTDRMTGLFDVVPALFEQAGLPVPAGRQWVSASAALAGRPDPGAPKFAYCVHGADQFNPSTWIMVADRRWKYVYYVNSESRELFDLERDPGELRNLAFDPAHAAQRAAMEGEVLRWFAATTRHGSTPWSAECR